MEEFARWTTALVVKSVYVYVVSAVRNVRFLCVRDTALLAIVQFLMARLCAPVLLVGVAFDAIATLVRYAVNYFFFRKNFNLILVLQGYCEYGGTCIISNGLRSCNCPPHRTGPRCGRLLGCDNVYCQNGGSCDDSSGPPMCRYVFWKFFDRKLTQKFKKNIELWEKIARVYQGVGGRADAPRISENVAWCKLTKKLTWIFLFF